jgi:hypothetical protein
MIAVDASETRKNSKTIVPEGALIVDWLEELTGADAIVSPLETMPLAEGTLFNHIEAGAVLAQIKHGGDLISSIGIRMNESIAKMVQMTAFSWQRVLIPVGLYEKDIKTGLARYAEPVGYDPFFVTPKAPKSWEALQSALWRWRKRGGTVEPCVLTPEDLKRWMEREDIDIKEMLKNPVKEAWRDKPRLYSSPRPDDPLQMSVPISDGRITLATLPGIGKGKAQDLWDISHGNLFDAIMRITTAGESNILPKGVASKTVEKNRTYFGFINDNKDFRFSLELAPEFFQKADKE